MAVAPPKSSPSIQPPEEQFWVKYSPNHEAVVSPIGSFVLHFAVLGGLAIVGSLGLMASRANDPISVAAIQIEDGGGGGSPDGDGDKQGTAPKEEVGKGDPNGNTNTKTDEPPDPDQPKLNPVNPDDPMKVEDPDTRLVDKALAISQGLVSFSKDVNNDLMASVKPKGKGGTGTGGGEGTGTGTGTGAGNGSGSGNVNVRQKRLLRWDLVFETSSGDDYRRQLQYFGAILATPTAQKDRYTLYKKLERGERGQVEDVNSLNRIFFTDGNSDSVASLARALGIRNAPKRFVALFPMEFEEKLLRLELDYHRGKNEKDIVETRFLVKRRGTGYDVEVTGGR